jgi:hypothetical protein
MYCLSPTAKANYHKISSLKQQKLIILQSVGQNSDTGLKKIK